MSLSKRRKTVSLLVIAISTFFFIYDVPTFAADDIVCAIYAETAVLQQEQNKKYNCGFSGPEWNSSYDYHAKWCAGTKVTQTLTDKGTADRVNKLMGCKGVQYPAGADKWCNTYSILAINQNAANISNQCGFSGAEWNSDYEYHYKWCVKAPKSASEAGMNIRMEALKKCSK